MKTLIFLISLFSLLQVNSQVLIEINDEIRIMQNWDDFHVEVEDSISTNYKLDDFKYLSDSSQKIYFLNNSSGIVLHSVNSTLSRIDKSYDDKVHNKSLDFFYNDTIYRFGGYGYFQSNKDLIFYDKSSNSWGLVKYNGHEKIKPFSEVGFHFISADYLFIIGMNFNIEDLHNSSRNQLVGFKYDLKNDILSDVFEIDQSFSPPQSYFQINEDYVFLFYKKERKLKILSTKTLKTYEYLLDQNSSYIINTSDDGFLKKKGNLHFVIEDIFRQKKIHSISIEDVLLNMNLTSYRLIKQESYNLKYLSVLIILIILYLIFKRNDILSVKRDFFVKKDSIYSKKRSLKISSLEYSLIINLLDKHEVESKSLNEIFNSNNLNSGHVNRIKNQTIDRLNTKFKVLFEEKLIIKKKSSFDRRISLYKLNPNLSLIKEQKTL